ncbi:MAG: PfkB family carbohydrate kinase [Propionicimonas sp.]
MPPIDAVISGYVSLDRIIEVDAPLRPGRTSLVRNQDNATVHYGGCSINIAYGMARLGLTTRPCIRVGRDYAEIGLERFLLDGNVDTSAVTVVPQEMTSNCYLVEDESREHVTIYYPGAMDARHFQPLDPVQFTGARLGVITVGSEPDNREFLRRCREQDVPVAFGMKGDLTAFPAGFLTDVLAYSSVIFLNGAESATVQELLGLGSITDLFRSERVEIVVVTGGGRGSVCHQRQGAAIVSSSVPLVPGERTVDTTGCGDAYVAGFLYGYLKGEPGQVCGQLGATLASFVVEARGCCTAMPTPDRFWQRYHHHFQEDPPR